MSEVITIETAEMMHREALDTKPQDRFAGRLKFACCRQCGSKDGMQAVHRDTIDSMPAEALRLLDALYYAGGNGAYLFYACHRCNRDKVIPGGFVALDLDDVLCWINVGCPNRRR